MSTQSEASREFSTTADFFFTLLFTASPQYCTLGMHIKYITLWLYTIANCLSSIELLQNRRRHNGWSRRRLNAYMRVSNVLLTSYSALEITNCHVNSVSDSMNLHMNYNPERNYQVYFIYSCRRYNRYGLGKEFHTLTTIQRNLHVRSGKSHFAPLFCSLSSCQDNISK